VRYAEYGGAGRPPLAGTAVAARPGRRLTEKILEAARTERFWVLLPEPGGVWTLRQLDDTTGRLYDEPAHTSPPIGDNPAAAIMWAGELIDVECWHGMESHPGAYIDETYALVREIARSPRPHRRIVVRVEPHPGDPQLIMVTVAERWTATGRLSDPLYACEYVDFDDHVDMLAWVAGWYRLDPTGWDTITDGREYQHR
jgi:hypothetical protein